MFNKKMRSHMALEQVRKTEIYRAVKQHWMQALVVVGLCFVVLKKDIQIQLNLSSASSGQTFDHGHQQVQSGATPVKETKTGSQTKPKVEASKKIGAVQTSDSDNVNQLAIIDPAQLWTMLKESVMETDQVARIPDSETKLKSSSAPKVVDSHVEKKSVAKKTKSAESAPVANNYSYLTFVLSPTYAKRKGIPQSVVDEKLGACRNYIKRFAPVAISERKKYGVPASIKLAQALLESNSGESRLAQQNNNHFGIKCFKKNCKKGHCRNFTDDSHKDFFRNYPNNWESYRAHSLFLQRDRYKGLQKLGVEDYKGWAYGLKKAGYATDKKYAEKLIRIIEFFNLDDFDA